VAVIANVVRGATKPKMETKAYQISIYLLGGLTSALPGEETAIELARLTAPSFKALLTLDPEPHFTHIDRASAVLARWATSGVAKFNEPLTAEIADAKRSRNTPAGLFLVIQGEMEIAQQTFSARREGDEFGLILGEVRTADIQGRFEPLAQSALVALSFLHGSSFGFKRIGSATYLNDAGSTKPIYVFDIVGGERAECAVAGISVPQEWLADVADTGEVGMHHPGSATLN
jgi:hypothetical protein